MSRTAPSHRVRVTELSDSGSRRREDRVAGEEPLEIRLEWPGAAARRVWVTMRTPGHDFELAAGYCFHEGLIDPRSIRRVAYCTDVKLAEEERFNVVTVSLSAPPLREPSLTHDAMATGSSACGVCGKESLEQALSVRVGSRWLGDLPTQQIVRSLPDRLRDAQPLFDVTGGVHAAGLATADGQLLVVREDVGRHNAVDKLAGNRILAGEHPAAAVLVLSGRVGFELLAKASAAGHGAVVAVGAPSALAVRLAAEAGIVLYGFSSGGRTVRYTGE